jgi:hypothetical protein
LVFSSDGSYPLLIDASFKTVGKPRANTKLVDDPPGGKFLHAFCILMLLSKYEGVNPEKPDEDIVFQDEKKGSSWLNTLGKDKAELHGIIFKYFEEVNFFSSRRITAKTRALTRYHPKEMLLENVRLWKSDPSDSESDPVLLKRSELVSLAKNLEKHCEKTGIPWKKTVRKQAIRIDGKIGHSKHKKIEQSIPPSSSCICSPKWQELFDESLNEMEGREAGGRWFVICITPSWMLQWRKHFCNAVQNGATVKFVYNAPNSADSSIPMEALWRMNTGNLKNSKPIDLIKARLTDSTSQLRAWAEKERANESKGSFEFFKSIITHPFTAILVVPEVSNDNLSKSNAAPPGTVCLLGHYTFYPKSVEDRLGMCLRQPSPLLDIYYNSITKFFEQGVGDGYLKPDP